MWLMGIKKNVILTFTTFLAPANIAIHEILEK